MIDYTPPYNDDAEMSVIGSVLMDPESIDEVVGKLQPTDFYRVAHQLIFQAYSKLSDSGKAIDIVILAETLGDDLESAGGVSYLTELATVSPSAAALTEHIEIVKNKSKMRTLMRNAQSVIEDVVTNNDDPDSVISRAEALLSEGVEQEDKGFVHIEQSIMSTFERVENLYKHGGEVTGTTTGYEELDKMTAGWQDNNLIIIAARPAVGKTALALNFAANAADKGKAVAIFSLEMGHEELTSRLLSSRGHINGGVLKSGHLDKEDWENLMIASGSLSNMPIYIDDKPGSTVGRIRSMCRMLQRQQGLDMVVIDYLQLMSGSGDGRNRQQEVSEISRGLKNMARELEVPVIALSQLSRSVEQREDKRPVLSDLRESGSLEQDKQVSCINWVNSRKPLTCNDEGDHEPSHLGIGGRCND